MIPKEIRVLEMPMDDGCEAGQRQRTQRSTKCLLSSVFLWEIGLTMQ